ncbi:MAG: GNAT family N-acetyltransferase, partial [Bryobacteraceae bacterium]
WTGAAALRPSLRAQERVRLETWDDRHHEEAAHLIADCYQDHIDAQINDQYRSVAGARKFLHNITQYPGCGTFYKPGSHLAFDRAGGDLAGLSLASLVRHDVGHITQICVGQRWRGLGVGYELLRTSLCDLRAVRCRKVTLTVTAANREALDLYERMGFTNVRNFCAYVWEGFRR